MNPEVFPDSKSFDPSHWIRAAERKQHLESNLVLFSKDTRICLGINMAYAELYMVVAGLTRRVKMELHDTTSECVEPGRDHVIVVPKNSNGVRATDAGINTS